jgi:hypothetical protein
MIGKIFLVRCAAVLAVMWVGIWFAFDSMSPEVQIKTLDAAVQAWIGLVDLCKSAIASPSFWMAAGGIGAWLQSWVNGRKATKAVVAAEGAQAAALTARAELVDKIDTNTRITEDVKTVAVRSKAEMEAFGIGKERHGVTMGIQIERDRASAPAPLRPDFNPDEFVAGHGTDQNDKR